MYQARCGFIPALLVTSKVSLQSNLFYFYCWTLITGFKSTFSVHSWQRFLSLPCSHWISLPYMSLGLLYQFADTCEKVQRCRNICACANSGHLDLLRADAHWKRVWAYSVTFAFPYSKYATTKHSCRVKNEISYLFSVYDILLTPIL